MWSDIAQHDVEKEPGNLRHALSRVPVPDAAGAESLGSVPFQARYDGQPRPPAVAESTILVFDSGLGGLTVFREVARRRPDARFVYVADDALFPYGGLPEHQLIDRVVNLMAELIPQYSPDLVVIACNTASTLVLPPLRARFAIPFVGTVPAIKPACAASKTRLVAVLGTEATVRRDYTHALVRQHRAQCQVTLVGSKRLAGYAESELSGTPVADERIWEELAPCFVRQGAAETDTIVLACTHYPLLINRFRKISPWPVEFIDPAPAIARRVEVLLGAAQTRTTGRASELIFTSGRTPDGVLSAALQGFGFARPAVGAPLVVR